MADPRKAGERGAARGRQGARSAILEAERSSRPQRLHSASAPTASVSGPRGAEADRALEVARKQQLGPGSRANAGFSPHLAMSAKPHYVKLQLIGCQRVAEGCRIAQLGSSRRRHGLRSSRSSASRRSLRATSRSRACCSSSALVRSSAAITRPSSACRRQVSTSALVLSSSCRRAAASPSSRSASGSAETSTRQSPCSFLSRSRSCGRLWRCKWHHADTAVLDSNKL